MADELNTLIDTVMSDIFSGRDSMKEVAEAPTVEAPAVAETFEQQQTRVALEEYRRRNEESLKQRKEILESNGLKFEDYTPAEGVEIYRRCCGK